MRYKRVDFEDVRFEERLDEELESDAIDLNEWGFEMGYNEGLED